jgi:hypothetical protein
MLVDVSTQVSGEKAGRLMDMAANVRFRAVALKLQDGRMHPSGRAADASN